MFLNDIFYSFVIIGSSSLSSSKSSSVVAGIAGIAEITGVAVEVAVAIGVGVAVSQWILVTDERKKILWKIPVLDVYRKINLVQKICPSFSCEISLINP